MRQLDRPGQIRLMGSAVLLAFLLGPVSTGLGAAVDNGEVGLGAFAMLVFPCGLLLREIGKQAEHLALGTKGRPWLGGRMTRLQKLILPYGTASVLTSGFSAAFAGGAYLLTAAPLSLGVDVIALGFVAFGGLFLGFGIGRVVAGILIVHFSGLWAAPRWAWMLGGGLVAGISVAHAIYSVEQTLRIVPSL